MSSNVPIPGTGISAFANESPWNLQVYYQLLDGQIQESKCGSFGVWTNSKLPFTPLTASPLTSVAWEKGREVRVYYLDADCIIQEFAYTDGKGWYRGKVGELKAKANPSAGLAAVVKTYSTGPDYHTRVYYQKFEDNTIAELADDKGTWKHEELLLLDAFAGTSLAAVLYTLHNETNIRLFYQARDLTLKEYCHNTKNRWFPGEFNPGKATARTPLTALAFGNVELQVYWRDLEGRVVTTEHRGFWQGPPRVIPEVGPGYEFYIVEWGNGRDLRLYNQQLAGSVVETSSENGGRSWHAGPVLAKGEST